MTVSQSASASRFAPALANNIGETDAARKAQEIADKLSMTLTGSSASGGQNLQAPGAGAGGAVSITMEVPVEKVGLVIGRAGTTIREIQDSAGVRLQLDSQGEPTRQLRITGSSEGVEIAKTRVQGLLNQPTFGGRVPVRPLKTIQIPSECVGFVIGKGGETIKRISQETSCRMQVENEEEAARLGHSPPMPGHQNLHLTGTTESVSRAEAEVMELLEKKQRTGNRGGGSAGYSSQLQAVYQLREQPYPTYSAPQGYPQVTQQAYAVAPNAVQGYASKQMQGYGKYVPQYATYAPPIPPQQTPADPQSYPPSTSQHYSSYPSQSQQPAPLAQLSGYPTNAEASQLHTQRYPQNLQQQPTGLIPNTQQIAPSPTAKAHQMPGVGMPQMGYMGVSQPQMNQIPGVSQPTQINHACYSAGSQQYQPTTMGCTEGPANQPMTPEVPML